MTEFLAHLTEAQSLLIVGAAIVVLLVIFWIYGAIVDAVRYRRGDPMGDHCEHCEQVEALARKVAELENWVTDDIATLDKRLADLAATQAEGRPTPLDTVDPPRWSGV